MLRSVLAALILLSAGIAGCVQEAPAATVAPASVPAAAAVTAYLRNLSEPMPGVDVASSLLEQTRIPAPDGVLLDTWIVRPDVEGPVPLVLTVTPYYGGGPPVLAERVSALGMLADVLVPRGYAVGVSSVRGTGNSEGCFTIGGPSEAKDTAAVIEHLAAQPWSNGRVGLVGVSYPGTTPQDVWIEAPPALKTIVPIAGISDFYKYNFVNGVPINVQGFGFNTYYWVVVGLAPVGLNRGAQALDPLSVPGAVAGEACTDQVEVQEGGVSSTLDGNKDAYWQARDFLAELRASPDKPRASVFYVHGLQDWNVKPHMMEDWLPAVQETGVPFKAWLGQWTHEWPQREDWWEHVMVAWFDQFLKEVDTGILDAPAVQVQDDDGTWRHEEAWPPRDVDWLALHPHADGALAPTPGSGEASYHDRMGEPLGVSLAATGPGQAGHVLFRSEPLAEDLHLSGLPVFEGNVTATGRRASLMLTLAEERADGTLRPFNFAALSLNHAESLAQGKDDVSGLTQAVALRFFPQDDVAHKGSRLVLLAAGNLRYDGEPGPDLQPIGTGSTLTLHLDGAVLRLPVDRSILPEEPQPEAPERRGLLPL